MTSCSIVPDAAAIRRRTRCFAAAMIGALAVVVGAPNSASASPFVQGAAFSTAALTTTGRDFIHTATAPDGTSFVTWITEAAPITAMVAIHRPGGEWSTQSLGTAANVASGGGAPVAVAGDGTATVVFPSSDGSLRTTDCLPGGTFGTTRALTVTATNVLKHRIDAPSLAISRNGTAVAAWYESNNDGSTWQVVARIRVQGSWDGPPYPLGPNVSSAGSTSVTLNRTSAAINDAGRAAVGFIASDGSNPRARIAVRPAGADFLPAVLLDNGADPGGWVSVAMTAGGGDRSELRHCT